MFWHKLAPVVCGGILIYVMIEDNKHKHKQVEISQLPYCNGKGICKINNDEDWHHFLNAIHKSLPPVKSISFNEIKFSESDNIDLPLNEVSFSSCQGSMNILKTIQADRISIDRWLEKIPGWNAGLWHNSTLFNIMVKQRPVVLPKSGGRILSIKEMKTFDLVLIHKGNNETTEYILDNIINKNCPKLEYIKYYDGYRNVIRDIESGAVFYIKAHDRQGGII